jgi:hypothetical protein
VGRRREEGMSNMMRNQREGGHTNPEGGAEGEDEWVSALVENDPTYVGGYAGDGARTSCPRFDEV